MSVLAVGAVVLTDGELAAGQRSTLVDAVSAFIAEHAAVEPDLTMGDDARGDHDVDEAERPPRRPRRR